jgi:hypothetical protein
MTRNPFYGRIRHCPSSSSVAPLVDHPPSFVTAGLTQAETEKALPKGMLGVMTSFVVPLKLNAELIFPVVQVAPFTVPLYPDPKLSCAMLPEPSSKFQ